MRTAVLISSVSALLAASCARDARPLTAQPAPQAQPTGTTGSDERRAGEITAFVDPGAETRRQPVVRAIAVLRSTADNRRIGTVQFIETGHDGLDVYATVEGLEPGEHAYHVHLYGDCSSPDAKSAGPHFHFTGSSLDPEVKMITGNLGELIADAEGRASHRARLPFARLHGPFSLLGRAVVVHERGNDPSVTPDGAAGDRIACAVIGVANPEHTSTQPTARR